MEERDPRQDRRDEKKAGAARKVWDNRRSVRLLAILSVRKPRKVKRRRRG